MDDWELLEVLVVVTIFAIWGGMRLFNRRRVVDSRAVKIVGSFGGIDVTLMSSLGGRRYVGLNYEIEDDDKVRDIEVLLTSANARRLAEMLEIAVAPGKTLLQARVAARRRSLPKKPVPQASP